MTHMIAPDLRPLLELGPRELDFLFLPDSLPAGEEARARLRDGAAALGERWADELWDGAQTAAALAAARGVTLVRDMSPLENTAYRARALYDPNTRQILVSRERIAELEEIQRSLGLTLFDAQQLYDRLLLHELFHHLEEERGAPRDIPWLRDVGAFAFANRILGEPCCQRMDLIWLLDRAPGLLREKMVQLG